MDTMTNDELSAYKKWSLKEKINYIREYMRQRGYAVTLKHDMVEWVGINESGAGSISIKFLQEMGELDFENKIITYFNYVTDLPNEKSTATQRERNVRDNNDFYNNVSSAFKKDGGVTIQNAENNTVKFDDEEDHSELLENRSRADFYEKSKGDVEAARKDEVITYQSEEKAETSYDNDYESNDEESSYESSNDDYESNDENEDANDEY